MFCYVVDKKKRLNCHYCWKATDENRISRDNVVYCSKKHLKLDDGHKSRVVVNDENTEVISLLNMLETELTIDNKREKRKK
eukprot:UN29328